MNNIIQISIIRNLLLCIWIFIIALTPLENLTFLPIEAVEAWGVGNLLTLIPKIKSLVFTFYFLGSIKILTIILCTASLFFASKKWLFLVSVLLIFLIDTLLKSYNGFINHAQMGTLYMLIFFVFFPKIKVLAIQDLFKKFGKSNLEISTTIQHEQFLYLLKLAVIIPYSLLGLERIIFGGFFHKFSLFYTNALEIYVLRTSHSHSNYSFNFFPELFAIPAVAVILNIGFLIITLMELFSIGILFSSLFRKMWLLVILPFHIITLFSMNILFWENILLIIVLFMINQKNQIPLKINYNKLSFKKNKLSKSLSL